MISGVGFDLCSIKRISKAIEHENFITRVFNHDEIIYCESKKSRRAESYAACFAAREAFMKASGISLAKLLGGNFELAHDNDTGKPFINLKNELAKEFVNKKISVSISHEDDLAGAIVIIEE